MIQRIKMTIFSFFLLAFAVFSSIFGNQKVALMNDTSDWYHWGCTGTSLALKEGIEKLGFEIQAIPISVVYSLKEVPEFNEFNDPLKFQRFCEENQETVEIIQSADVVVINGEGTIHDLRKGPRTLLYLAYISKTFFKKHVEIVNHSAYPKDDPSLSPDFSVWFLEDSLEKIEAKKIYERIYSQLDFIAIREPFSQKEMSNLNVVSKLGFDCLPLYIRDHYQTQKWIEGKTLVIAGSVAFTEIGVIQLCRYIEAMEEKGFKIKVLIGAKAHPSKDDEAFVSLLKTHCNNEWELTVATSLEEWLDTINHATLLVSGRFHHSIAAFCLNTPFIAINSNTYKVHGVCSFLEVPEPLIFSEPHLLDHLLIRTEEIISSSILNNAAKIAEICQLSEKNFDGLKWMSLQQ